MISNDLISQLANCVEVASCKQLANSLLFHLKGNPNEIKQFSDTVSMPFSDHQMINAFDHLLTYTEPVDSSDDWMLHLAANVILHSRCGIVRYNSIIRQFARRIAFADVNLFEFLLSEMNNDDGINCLNDGIFINLNQLPTPKSGSLDPSGICFNLSAERKSKILSLERHRYRRSE